MQLIKYQDDRGNLQAGLLEQETVVPLVGGEGDPQTLFALLDSPAPAEEIIASRDETRRFPLADAKLRAPIDQQEVWAAGVTYTRSRTARMEESEGAARFYDAVYDAPRPELFFKANPHRVVGPNQPVRIRQDSQWSVPEPELTLVLNTRCELVGYTIGNDMSARDIEGENPLYLPQAKIYDAACSLGPAITLTAAMPPLDQIDIGLKIHRSGDQVFSGTTSAGNLHRRPQHLVDWLGREASFPTGAFLMTGTGIVPDDDFTLEAGDRIEITIEGIGTLENCVTRG